MSELSNEDKQRKQNLLDELKVMREKKKEILAKRNALQAELNPSAPIETEILDLTMGIEINQIEIRKQQLFLKTEGTKIDGEISKLENEIQRNQDKIATLESNLDKEDMDEGLKLKKRMYIRAEDEAQELENELAIAREKQRLEQIKLQELESKQRLPAEGSKGLFAFIVSSVKRFLNRKNITMEKRQAEIDINEARRRVNEATNVASDIEEKMKSKKSIAQSFRSDYEEEKAKTERTKLDKQEKANLEIQRLEEIISKQEEEKSKKEKMWSDEQKKVNLGIRQLEETIAKQEEEKKTLEAKKEETLKKILARPKEETERIKKERDQAKKDLETVNAEIRDIQAKIKEIDPNHYLTKELVDNLFSGILGYPPKSAKAQENEELQEHKTISPDSEEKRDTNNGAKEPTQRGSFRARLRDFTPVKQETRQQTEKQFERNMNIKEGEEWTMG